MSKTFLFQTKLLQKCSSHRTISCNIVGTVHKISDFSFCLFYKIVVNRKSPIFIKSRIFQKSFNKFFIVSHYSSIVIPKSYNTFSRKSRKRCNTLQVIILGKITHSICQNESSFAISICHFNRFSTI